MSIHKLQDLCYAYRVADPVREMLFALQDRIDALEAQRKPLTDVEILNIHALMCWPRTMFADKSYGIALDTVTVKDFTRAIEAAHGIKERLK